MLQRTGTRIQIPSQPDPGSNPPARTVTITGPGDTPQRAKYEIDQLIAGQEASSGGGGGGGSYGSYGGGAYGGAAYGGAAYGGAYADPYAYYQQQGYSYGQWGAQQPVEGGDPNGAAQPAAGTEAATGADANAAVDPTMYHEQFWQYAAYYGEELGACPSTLRWPSGPRKLHTNTLLSFFFCSGFFFFQHVSTTASGRPPSGPLLPPASYFRMRPRLLLRRTQPPRRHPLLPMRTHLRPPTRLLEKCRRPHRPLLSEPILVSPCLTIISTISVEV